MDGRQFRNIAGRFVTGVTVVSTVNQEGRPVGLTVNSFASLSLEPLLVLFNIDKSSRYFQDFMQTHSFAVNILSEGQEALSQRFATKDIDRFEGVSYRTASTGAPILEGTIGYFDCKVENRFEGGDHVIIVGRVVDGSEQEGNPLLFYRGKYARISGENTRIG